MNKLIQTIFLVSIGLSLLNSCDSTPPSLRIEQLLTTELDSLLAQTELTSVSVGLLIDGKRFKVHRGELIEGKAPTDQSLYEIASLTKTFTGTLLAHAIVEGKVSIDDDIREYLEGDFPNLEFEGHPITFRHLVTHTGGIPRMFPQNDLFDNPDFDTLPFQLNELQAGYTKAEFMEALGQVGLDTIPGYQFSYSNAGANLIGYCLEQMYGMSYEDILQQKILAPLEMTDTKINLDESEIELLAEGFNASGVAMPYGVKKDMSAEGGIKSNLDDMLSYLSYHLRLDDPVIKASHQELWEGRYGDYESGLFWQIFKHGDNPDRVFQNGGAFGTSSWITLIPESSIGIFMVTNMSRPEVHGYMSVVVNDILAAIAELPSPRNE